MNSDQKIGCKHLTYFSSEAVYDPALSRVNEYSPFAAEPLRYDALRSGDHGT